MVYVITEDSNSARSFWIKALKTFNKTINVLDLPANKSGTIYGGNGSLEEQLKNTVKILKPYDTIIVIFDNIGDTIGFSTSLFLDYAIDFAQKHSINLIVTTYYCFEELYLSYNELIRMYSLSPKRNNVVFKVLDHVSYCINNSINYFKTTDKIVTSFIRLHPSAGKNREHFANALLMEVTKALPNWFSILKKGDCFGLKSGGQCWINSCYDIQSSMSEEHVKQQCVLKCTYKCKNKDTREKLLDLEENSICKITSLGLSGIDK